MASKYSAGWIDNSNEASSTNLYFPQINAGNIATVLDNGIGGNLGDVRLALAAISLCNFTGHSVQAVKILEQGTTPVSKFAQRESKLRFDYVDTAGYKGSFTVPGPNLALFGQAGSDIIDKDEATVAAFIAAVEAKCVSRFDNAITILRGVVTGRNI